MPGKLRAEDGGQFRFIIDYFLLVNHILLGLGISSEKVLQRGGEFSI